MNVDNWKNSMLTSHKTEAENADIQNKLNLWFKEKGIINKLRAHIREQMISALKDNSMWNTNKKNVNSPKIQAINLLVADFLINQENLFTLSVFTTEVPLLGNLHEFSSYVNRLGNNTQKIPITKPSFQLNDVQDILEALGIQSNSDITELTSQYYFNEKKVHSLLACLFKSITTIRNDLSKYNEVQINQNCKEINKLNNIENNTYEHRLNNWLVSIEDILCSFNLNKEQKNTLKMLLKKYHQNNAQETAVYKEHLKKLERQNKEMVEKVADIEQMLAAHFHSHDSKLMFQKEEINYATQQLRLEQQQLYQLINVFEEKEKSIQEKLEKSEEEYKKNLQYIENQKYELRLKEMDILRHEKMLKGESPNYINETKISEPNQVQLLQEQNIDLAKQLVEIKSKLDKLERYKKAEQTYSKKNDNLQKINSLSLQDQEMVKNLQKDNDELREFIKVQRQRIEELSYRVSNLAKQIEKTHQVPLTKTDYDNRNVRKKLCFVDNSSRKNHYITQNISSTTTDYSTTVLESDNLTEDDIIQEAESKLKNLEINSAKVAENLKNFPINSSRRNIGFNVIKNTKKSYKKNCSNFSDDSDLDALKCSSNKINLKELANKIGYHRSVKRSMNYSQSENDTSPEISRNTKFQGHKNSTNISPIEILSSNIKENVCEELSINKPSSRTESPINKSNYRTEISLNTSNISVQSPKENKLLIESDVKNICIPNTNNDNFDLQLFKSKEIIDSEHKQTSILKNSSNGVDTLSNSKKLQESDHTISFGSSNKTDKSSDFWAS